jgi:hypothetical protein
MDDTRNELSETVGSIGDRDRLTPHRVSSTAEVDGYPGSMVIDAELTDIVVASTACRWMILENSCL